MTREQALRKMDNRGFYGTELNDAQMNRFLTDIGADNGVINVVNAQKKKANIYIGFTTFSKDAKTAFLVIKDDNKKYTCFSYTGDNHLDAENVITALFIG